MRGHRGFTAVVLSFEPAGAGVSQVDDLGSLQVVDEVITRLRRAGAVEVHMVVDSSFGDHSFDCDELTVADRAQDAIRYVLQLQAGASLPTLVVDSRCLVDWYLYANLALGPVGAASVLGVRSPTRRIGHRLGVLGGFVSDVHRVECELQPCLAGAVRLQPLASSGSSLGNDSSTKVPEWDGFGVDVPLCNVVPELLAIQLGAGLDVLMVEPGSAAIALVEHPKVPVPTQLIERSEDEVDRARMRDSVKVFDGVFTSYFISPWTQHLARAAARRGLRPNQITSTSFFITLVAAVLFSFGQPVVAAVAGVLVIFAFGLDCADGQLARYSWQFSVRGAWLDLFSDRVKEVALVVGLIIGSGATRGAFVAGGFVLALVALRHAVNSSYLRFQRAERRRRQVDALPQQSLVNDTDLLPVGLVGAPISGPPPAGIVRRLLAFPIGERLLVIAVGSALVGMTRTLVLLCAGQIMALVWQLSGRIFRSIGTSRASASMDLAPEAVERTHAASMRSQFGWLANPALVGIEVLLIAVFIAIGGAQVAKIAYLALIVVYLSNETFRSKRATTTRVRLPVEPIRIGYVLIGGALWPQATFTMGAVALALVIVISSVASWRRTA